MIIAVVAGGALCIGGGASDATARRRGYGRRNAGVVVGPVERSQVIEVTQSRLNVLHVHLDVVTQQRHVRLVQRFAQIVQGVVQCLQLIRVALALRQAL